MAFFFKALSDKLHNKVRKSLRAGQQSEQRPFPPSHLMLSASMTVEAAFIVPFFIFFMADILNILDMIRLQSRITAALHETGTELAEAAFYYRYGLSDLLDAEAGDDTYSGELGADLGLGEAAGSFILSETYVRASVERHAGREYLSSSCLSGGSGSISYLRSQILSSGDNIDLIADYRVKPLIPVFGISDIPLSSRYFCHAWVGYNTGGELPDHDKSDEVMVYITDCGSVYHRDRGCTYLNPSVRYVPSSEMSGLRNRNGARYYPCEICRPSLQGTVAITNEGNRYHCSPECSGLKRTIRETPLSSVEGVMPGCSKCTGGGK